MGSEMCIRDRSWTVRACQPNLDKDAVGRRPNVPQKFDERISSPCRSEHMENTAPPLDMAAAADPPATCFLFHGLMNADRSRGSVLVFSSAIGTAPWSIRAWIASG